MNQTSTTTTPSDCPGCGAELYPVRRLRPQPKLDRASRLLMFVGLSLSAAIVLGGFLWYSVGLREWVYSDKGPRIRTSHEGGAAGVIVFIPAVVPGLIFGWLAHRRPKVLALRCRACAWRERYRIGRDGKVTALAMWPTRIPRASASRAADPTTRALAAIGTRPPPPSSRAAPEGTTALDRIVDDDPLAEVSAWVYAEIATGRTPEDVAAELVRQGWSSENAEALAENGRRATRHLRG